MQPDVAEVLRQERGSELLEMFQGLPARAEELSLSQFSEFFISDYDVEARFKKWKTPIFKDTLGSIWDKHQKSCVLAPREHLKTSTVLEYIVKRLFTRKYPLEINYYHLTGGLAYEKFNKLTRTIRNNPILDYRLGIKESKSWSTSYIELKDGSIIQPLSYQQGVVGKHPHIIILDDVIDRTVIYSDDQNRKAIDKFYSDIYPMISKADPDKRIIIIGTAQRKDDLYHSLPADFHFKTFQAIVSESKKKVLSPELFTWDELMAIKRNISENRGEKYWLKEYMNVPFSQLGLVIKAEDIRYYATAPDGLEIFQGWDLSVGRDLEKGDWTAGATIGIDWNSDPVKIYILDVYRARIDFPERKKIIIEKGNDWKPQIIGVEDTAFQYDTVQEVKKSSLHPIEPVKPIRNKIESFQIELAPYFENHQVYVKEDMHDLVNELLSLPVGEYDDQADALKIAIKMARIKGEYDEPVRVSTTKGLRQGVSLE